MMKLKLILASLLAFLSNSTAQEAKSPKYIETTHSFLKTLDDMVRFQFHDLNVNIRKKTIIYPVHEGNTLYFYIRKDHNGEAVYFLAYTLNFDLQGCLGRLSKKS